MTPSRRCFCFRSSNIKHIVLVLLILCGSACAQYAYSANGKFAPGEWPIDPIDDVSNPANVYAGAEISTRMQGATSIPGNVTLNDGHYGLYGGLVLDGSPTTNIPPADLLASLNTAANAIQCLNTSGVPATCGAASIIGVVSFGYSITQHYFCKLGANASTNWTVPSGCDANSVIHQMNAKSLASGVTFLDCSEFGVLTHDSNQAIHGSFDSFSGPSGGIGTGGTINVDNPYENCFTQELNGLGYTNAQVQAVILDQEYAGVLTVQGGLSTCTIKTQGCSFLLTDKTSLAWQQVADDADVMRALSAYYPNLKMILWLDHTNGEWGTPTDPRTGGPQLSPEPYMQQIPYAHRHVIQTQYVQKRTQTTISTTSFSSTTETVNFIGSKPALLVNGAFVQVSANSDPGSNTPCTSWGTATSTDATHLTWTANTIGHSLASPIDFDTRWPSGTVIHVYALAASVSGYDNTISSVTDSTHLVLGAALSAGTTGSGMPFLVSTCPGLAVSNVTGTSFQITQANSAGGSGGIFSVIQDNRVGGLDTNTAGVSAWLANVERSPNPANGGDMASMFQGNTGGNPGNHPTTNQATPSGAKDVSVGNTLAQTIYTNPAQFQATHAYTAGGCNFAGAGSCILDGTVTTAAIHLQQVTVSGTSGGSAPTWNHSGGTTTSGGVTFQDLGLWPLSDSPGACGGGSGQEWFADQVVQNLSNTAIACVSQYFQSLLWITKWACSNGVSC
jgi:hypothetical protein